MDNVLGQNGIFIALEPTEHFAEQQYLDLAKKSLAHYQTHINQVPGSASSQLRLFKSPATAVIVGTGTVGLEAIVYATRILPKNSTLIILQNDIIAVKKLEFLLTTVIKGGEKFKWIISPATDIGNIDQLSIFLTTNKEYLSNTQLFIHTADKAKRYLPANIDYHNVITQVIRRCSIPAIEDLIELHANADLPYVRILFSSICAQNRDVYRMPNIGHYQIGKIVGDDLFKSRQVKNCTYSFILYAGAMFTMGEQLTRHAEYLLLKQSNPNFAEMSAADYTASWSNAGTHADSMDSSGLMFKTIWQALQEDSLVANKIYSIYGSSVPENLCHAKNVLKVIEPAPYLFNPL